jgi:hypothetical protein
MYISQDLESRTYRNFGMYFFNTLNGTFQPRAFDPRPFGMYGVPGNPSEIVKQVEIPLLNDTQNQIQFLKDLIQSSVAQTPTERGEQTKSRTTLGEVQLNLQQSQGRNSVSAKHYRRAWEEIGEIFYELMNNNSSGMITLYKKGSDGNMYEKDIYPSDWQMPEGFACQVVMKSDSDAMDQFLLQKAQYTIQNFMDNPIALKIAKRKQLELMDWTQDEIDQAMQAEDQKMGMPVDPNADPAKPESSVPSPFNNAQMLQQGTQ